MKQISLGTSSLSVPVVAIGCMRLNRLNHEEAKSYLKQCIELGINFFDHADIYGRGQCEEIFGDAISALAIDREKMIIQSKCGICPGQMYDFSKQHILHSVDGILKRLKTDYLDVLVLHRPDALVEPAEVAEVFDQLQRSQKVRYFGVSNHKPAQIELLKKYVRQDLLVNQLQLSIPFSNMIANGLEVNMLSDGAIDRDGSILDYCRLNDITIQAWSPFQSGYETGVFLDSEHYPELNRVLQELADRYDVSMTTITTAWLLRHPANIQLIAGTMSERRLIELVKATEITLTRPEWYQIYLAAGHILP